MPKSELNELNTIVNSPALHRIIAEHKKVLQEKINKFVREKDLMGAYGEICRFDDCNRLMKLINQKITEIKKGENDGH